MIDLQAAFKKAWDIFINQELPIIWKPFEPYIIGALASLVLVGIVKFFGKKIAGVFSQLCGDTKRETKRKQKRFCDIVDLLSNLKDIFSIFSKR